MKKNSYAICPNIPKHTDSLAAKNEPNPNWRLRINGKRQQFSLIKKCKDKKLKVAAVKESSRKGRKWRRKNSREEARKYQAFKNISFVKKNVKHSQKESLYKM